MVWMILGITLGVLLLLDVAVHYFSVKMILPIFERSPMFQPRVLPSDPRAEEFEISSTNGQVLSACLFHRSETESRGIVIYCPEYGANKWSCMHYCEGLWEAGYDILSFEFRNSAQSSVQADYQPIHWVTDFEKQDVLAAISYVRSRDDLRERPIGLFGVSRGGGAALAAASESPDVELVTSDSAFDPDPMMMHFTRRWYSLYLPEWTMFLLPEWHLKLTMRLVRKISQRRRGCRYADIMGALRHSAPRKQTLMISGLSDSFVNGTVARVMANAAGESLEELWLVPKAKHNAARQLNPEQYDARVVKFFAAMSPLREDKASTLQPTIN